MSKPSDDKIQDKRLGRMTVFRGLASDKAIEATSAEIEAAAAEHDADGAPANDTDKGGRRAPKKQRETDVD